jgi:hypothetical protein
MSYNSGGYCGTLKVLTASPYSQDFKDGIYFPGNIEGLVTEDFNSFITTENGTILTTEG